LGFVKSRPLCARGLAEERVDARLLTASGGEVGAAQARAALPGWLVALRGSFNQALLLDRHLLGELEQNVCIASLREGASDLDAVERDAPPPSLASVDSLRLALARRFGAAAPDLRELPVSLLRLYFSGHSHFRAIVARLSNPAFYHLRALARADGAVVDADGGGGGGGESLRHPAYTRDRAVVAHYLATLCDLAFCSFERALCALMASRATGEWYDAGLGEALRDDPYWAGLPRPPAGTTADLWYLCVWRCNVTLLLEKHVKPWGDDDDDAETRDWLLYRQQLYRDTHLDLLTVMASSRVYDDDALMRNGAMRTHYPAANRVCCAEELPDLSAYALDNFKTGAHLKERSTIAEKMGHIYGNKTGPNICKDRNSPEIIRAYGEQDPVLYEQIKQTLRCGLLGNMPRARGTLNMAARIRVNLSFWPEHADRVMTREEIDAVMHPYCNPYANSEHRRAEKARKEGEKMARASPAVVGAAARRRLAAVMEAWDAKERVKMAYEKTALKMWMIRCRHVVSSLIREHQFYNLECGGCIDQYLSLDYKWVQYKNITRIANGQCRNELSRQAATLAAHGRFDWSVIEFIEKSPDGKYDVKRGKIMMFHTAALKVTKKVMKRNFLGILEVKATGIEEKIHLDRATPLAAIYCTEAEAAAQGAARTKMSEDELHFMCYCIAMRRNPVVATALFQVMGMTRAGVEAVREWMLDYYTYDIPDDSFKKGLLKFARASIDDYMIMKTALALIALYARTEQLFHLPAPFARRQIDAQRRCQLAIEDNVPTPAVLGIYYKCAGCQKFANSIVAPVPYPHHSNHCELAHSRYQIWPGCGVGCAGGAGGGGTRARGENKSLVLCYEGKAPRTLEHHRKRYAVSETVRPAAPVQAEEEADAAPKGGGDAEAEQAEAEAEEEGPAKKSENISFLNVAFYNPADGRAYCIKNKRQRIAVGGLWTPAQSAQEHDVIMTADYGRIVVRCNMVPVNRAPPLGGGSGGAGGGGEDDYSTEESGADAHRRGGSARRPRREYDTDAEEEEEDGEDGGAEAGEEGDDDDDYVAGEDEAEGAEQPGYESDLLSLFGDVQALNGANLSRLEQFARARARDLTTQQSTAAVEGSSSSSTSTTNSLGAPRKNKRGTPAVRNNKKRILRAVRRPIEARFNCRVPLQAIDMVGVEKSGKVLCVDCGVMTEYGNENMTPYGPVCMRRLCASMQRHHPAWQAASGGGGGGGGADAATVQFVESWQLHGQQAPWPGEMTRARKRALHPLARIRLGEQVGPLRRCHVCALLPPEARVTARDANYRLHSVACCGVCHHNLRPLLQRQYMVPLRAIVRFAQERGYAHLLHVYCAART